MAAVAVIAGVTGCGPSISEPWVSGEWGERLENERTRTDEQQQQLRERLAGYAEPYD
ncbi:MAG: hypothetical protein WD382_00630 [Halofilum sp. (in: g-proteobacteria)]